MEDGCGATEGVLVAMDVGVSTVEKEMSSAVGEDGEAGGVGSVTVVKSDMV